MNQEYLKNLQEAAKKAIDHFQDELANIHTGRATTGLVSDVLIESYGSKMPLKQIANITVTDPHSIAIQPWDKGNVIQIENALREANLSLGVVNTGDKVQVTIPQLTEERRNDYVKLAKEKAEEAKISIRNLRHDVMESNKKAKSNGEIAEDEMYRREEEVQKFVEAKNKEIDEVFANKEKELKEV